MFEWLREEAAGIGTPMFHDIQGSVEESLRSAISESRLELPESYKSFVLQFGNVKLYRQPRGGHTMGVFAAPHECTSLDGEAIYDIGFYDDSHVCVKQSDAIDGNGEKPIYETNGRQFVRAADSFHEWLRDRCETASRQVRDLYGPSGWQQVVAGPPPFTADETSILTARKSFKWHVRGTAANGKLIFEVFNNSDRILRRISIGARSRDGTLNGRVHLDVSNIKPGETASVEANCYKDLVPRGELELFELPDPAPWEREHYGELRHN